MLYFRNITYESFISRRKKKEAKKESPEIIMFFPAKENICLSRPETSCQVFFSSNTYTITFID